MDTRKITLWIMVFLILISCVSAFGIKPAKKEIDYSGEQFKEYTVDVVNSLDELLELNVYAEGELKDYMVLAENSISLGPGEYPLVYGLNLTSDLKPGLRTGRIIFEEKPDEEQQSIGTRLKLAYKISVNVPYPDKYLEPDLTVTSDDKFVYFNILLNNLGTLDVGSVRGLIDIYDRDEKVSSLKAAYDFIPSKTQVEFSSKIERSKLPNGRYDAIISLQYDDESSDFNESFTVGNIGVGLSLPKIYFTNDTISKFEIKLENLWNEDFRKVYVDILISDGHYELANMTTYSIDLGARAKENIYAYWDTKGMPFGDYYANVTVHFSQYSVSKVFGVTITSKTRVTELTIYDALTSNYIILLLIFNLAFIVVLYKMIVRGVKNKRFK